MYETSKIFGLLYVFMGDVLFITCPNVGGMCTGIYGRDETFRDMEDTERNPTQMVSMSEIGETYEDLGDYVKDYYQTHHNR